jgi:SAM-dependent methyltransferase
MSHSLNDCYSRPPLAVEDHIPVFSETDYYVRNYDRIAADHLKHFEAFGHNPFIREEQWKEVEASTEALIRKYANGTRPRILDVGVGMGRLLERFPQLDRFGMDISRGYLNYAKAKGIEVCMSRIEEMPYKPGYFDMAVTTDVLEHVLDLNLALKHILSVVKVGGIIIIRVPYREDLSTYTLPGFPYDLVHLRNFDENSLRLLFEKVFNLEVLEWSVSGYSCGRLKGSNVRYYSGLMHRFMALARQYSTPTFNRLSRKLCHPAEINMVLRNSTLNPART